MTEKKNGFTIKLVDVRCEEDNAYTAKLLFHQSHILGTMTTQWLDSDVEVTVDNCWQQGDYTVDQMIEFLHPLKSKFCNSQLLKITVALLKCCHNLTTYFLIPIVAPQVSRAWIGMNDLTTEMYYEWTDKSMVTFTNWAYYEPNNAGGEDCVEMYQTDVSPQLPQRCNCICVCALGGDWPRKGV